MLNVNVSPVSASAADGVKLYAVPTFNEVVGLPEIVGALFAGAAVVVTVIENAASAALSLPSDTLMRMFVYEPTFVAAGVPESLPVVALKAAQAGLFWIDQASVLLSTSVADGWNAYVLPA
jgi:hypothetical protein